MRYLIVLRAQFDDVVSRALDSVRVRYDFIPYYKFLRELDELTKAPSLAFATGRDLSRIPSSDRYFILRDAVAFPISEKDGFVDFDNAILGPKTNPDYCLDTRL